MAQYGFGKNTVGGAGGTSYVVSNLNDSGTGSLREAVDTVGIRYVSFSVSGNIDLQSNLVITNPNITIDGSTAPNKGICIKNYSLNINASEVIVKYMRMRLGDNGYKIINSVLVIGQIYNIPILESGDSFTDFVSEGVDFVATETTPPNWTNNTIVIDVAKNSADSDSVLISGSGISNVLITNCSISWSIDELLSTYATGLGISNITFQYNIISEALNASHHSNGSHSMASLINGDGTTNGFTRNVTFYKNYFAHNQERHVRANGGMGFELVNNVFYNWQVATIIGFGNEINIVNNHYKIGSQTPTGTDLVDVTSSGANGYVLGDTRVYVTGNTTDSVLNALDSALTNEATWVTNSGISANVDSVADAITDVLTNAGCTLPVRDNTDIRIINDYNNVTGGLIDTQEQVGGWEDLTQQLAFPTAYGAGAYTTGGRGQTVYYVTNLNDSGIGSFRDALGNDRIIIFAISGVINLTSTIDITINNVTIVGQTAPGEGITFIGETMILKGDNIIIRYLRFRGCTTNKDSFNLFYATNTIVDHCSFSFGEDEAFSVVTDTALDTNNVTVQNCFFGESTSGGSIVGDGSNAFMDRANNVSYIENIFHNLSHRFPNIAMDGRIDIINNITWNMQKRLVRGNGDYKLNQINNYYDYGTPIHDEILNHHSYSDSSTPTIYTTGNKIVSVKGVRTGTGYTLTSTIAEMNTDNFLSWKWFIDGTDSSGQGYGTTDRGDQLTTDYKTIIQHLLLGQSFTPVSADNVKSNIPSNAGAYKSLNADGTITINRDTYDNGWLIEIQTDVQSTYIGEPYPTPTLNSVVRPAGYDTSGDGMPDVWKTTKGLTPATDDSSYIWSSGYIGAEEFFNEVDITVSNGNTFYPLSNLQKRKGKKSILRLTKTI